MKQKLKKIITSLSKKSLIIRKLTRKILYIYRYLIFKLRTVGIKVENRTIIFSTFNGKSYSCSPKAIYEYMLNNEKYKDYNFIWAFKNPENYNNVKNSKNTIVVKTGSKEFSKALAKAKYWVFNYKVADELSPKRDQVFLQCWHGTPLKRLGCDLQHLDNQLNTIKEMKKRYKIEAQKFSYFLSPSKFATEKFISAWNLKEIGKENIIIEKGYPRNDFLYNYTEDDVKRIKENLQIDNINKKVILYAPTYRGNQHQSGIGYTYKTEVDFDKLQKELGDDYIILFRAHYFVANSFDFAKYEGFVVNVSDYDDINELYVISDMLITDYSSVFFDYANLRRPMIFHMYDLEHYRDESNGFYFDVEEILPGRITRTEDELIEEIKKMGTSFEYTEKYKKFNDKFNYLDDGHASKRVVETFIK